jgi:hypothetical membrane protein
MSSFSITARVGRPAVAHGLLTDARVAGAVLFGAGALALLGIITAEALYPVTYTTSGNEISDLGGTRPPAAIVFQPVATIFNVTMLATGLLAVIGALAGHRAFGRRLVTVPTAILGLAVLGVGVFPGNTGAPHAIAAMVAFVSGGVAAVCSTVVVGAPLRYAFAGLGALNLVSLASYFLLGDASPFWVLGVGGAERWVAYPIMLWLMGFGGYLAGRAEPTLEVTIG